GAADATADRAVRDRSLLPGHYDRSLDAHHVHGPSEMRLPPRPWRPKRGTLAVAVAAAHTAGQPEPENPLTTGLERLPVAPTTLVIFGATGDLARRKLLPALYNLAHEGALPERFHLVGVSRGQQSHNDYRAECEQAIRQFSRRTPDEDVLKV